MGFRDIPPNSEESNGKERENEMETGIVEMFVGLRVSQNQMYIFGSPRSKDYNALGSRLRSPYLKKLLTNWTDRLFQFCLGGGF